MNIYKKNGNRFGWGPDVAQLNPEKAELLKKYAIGNCLDVGFGSGIYSKYLKSLGLNVTGVDQEKDFVKKAKLSGLNCVVGSITKLPFSSNSFDCVVLFDVLEHVDDVEALKEVSRVGSRIIVSVPHANQELLLRYGLCHAHNLDRTHKRNYSVRTLRRKLKSLGWKIVEIGPALPLSISGLLIERLSHRILWVKLFLKLILKPFLPEPPIYSTVFAVAEKY
jgi:SAM-dependent methyltransferase